MSKRVPVYMSLEELETQIECINDVLTEFGPFPYGNKYEKLKERLEAELATFEE